LVLFDPLETKKTSGSIKALRPGLATEEVVEQVATYDEQDVVPATGSARDLYQALRERILKLDADLVVHARKHSVAFRVPDNWRNIFAVHFRTNKLRIELMRTKADDLNDPERKVAYIEDSPKRWNQHISQFDVGDVTELDYAVYLLQQAIERFKKAQESAGT
jgi:predicted transport protein